MNLTLEEIRLEDAVLQSSRLTQEQIDRFRELQQSREYQFWAQINLWNSEGAEKLEKAVLFLVRRSIVFALRNFPDNGRFEIFEAGKTVREMIKAGKGKIQFWVDANPELLKVLYFQEETRRAVSGLKKLRYEQL